MASRQVELVVRRPGQPERRMLLGPGVTYMGRAEDNDLVLPDIGVSRRHAKIEVTGPKVTFEDLGSGNGSFRRGDQITSITISDGDEVVIEPFTLVFRIQAVAVGGMPSLEDDETMRAPPLDALSDAPGRLVTLAGHRLASTYPLGGAPVTLGRSEARDVILYDPAASRNHASVELRTDGFYAKDFGSANGTYVNGQRITEQPLVSGDVLRIGSTEFRFEASGPVAAHGVDAMVSPPTVPTPPAGPAPAGYPPPTPAPVATTTSAPVIANDYYDDDDFDAPQRGAAGAVVAIVGFVVVVLLSGAAAVGLTMYQQTAADEERAARISQARERADAAVTAHSAEVADAVNQGSELLYAQRPLDALDSFFGEDASGEASRRGYAACEQVAFQQLERSLVLGAVSAAVQRRVIKSAYRGGRAAVRGRGSAVEALEAVDLGLVYAPDDASLLGLQEELREAVASKVSDEDRGALYAEVGPVWASGVDAFLRGDDDAARAAWQQVVETDADQTTWFAKEAVALIAALD